MALLTPEINHRWPTLPVSVLGAILTIVSVVLLLDLKIEADVYGLLGQQDEAVQLFDRLSSQTPGLEELLIICEPEYLLDRPTIGRISGIEYKKNRRDFFIRSGFIL